MSLGHVAVGGLILVIEGAGRRLAAQRNLPSNSGIKELFLTLADDCKQESATRNLGASDEVQSMMDSFSAFACQILFVNSTQYPFDDGTNRHGIAHGAYSDADYGSPINFYKTIAAVDFLTFIASFRANISWLASNPSENSLRIAAYYRTLGLLRNRASLYGAN
jgi:hypothetical protein